MANDLNLHDTTDAKIWAAEFCKRYPSALCQIPGKEGVLDGDDFEATMIGWFANAIMAGADKEVRDIIAAIPAATSTAQEAAKVLLEDTPDYDAGLLNDFGGGDVDWWLDYIRAEIGRANEYWRTAIAGDSHE